MSAELPDSPEGLGEPDRTWVEFDRLSLRRAALDPITDDDVKREGVRLGFDPRLFDPPPGDGVALVLVLLGIVFVTCALAVGVGWALAW